MQKTTTGSGPFSRILKALARVEPNEVQATVLSFLFVFILMAAYFILRPVRDAMASDWSREEVTWLWNGTFLFSIVAVSHRGAVYVIDRSGDIVFDFVNADYKIRLPAEDLRRAAMAAR